MTCITYDDFLHNFEQRIREHGVDVIAVWIQFRQAQALERVAVALERIACCVKNDES